MWASEIPYLCPRCQRSYRRPWAGYPHPCPACGTELIPAVAEGADYVPRHFEAAVCRQCGKTFYLPPTAHEDYPPRGIDPERCLACQPIAARSG
ncbi:MAG: hypothetical protein HY331_10970 [Chloroflexi bacterium]|nr:hypothetical protein [Chloroflexota bacterium]